MTECYDLLIVGGGINGTAIARDAAGRGLKVLLCERDDLANHTSSASTKLIHGGLRYLEYYEFKLVREALIERELLLNSAPHIIWPMRFVLPYDQGLRPAWLLRLGLLIYDHLGGRKKLPGTRTINLSDVPHRGVLEDRLKFGYEYSDCWVEDARLVVLNAVDARERGAQIYTQAEIVSVGQQDPYYRAKIKFQNGQTQEVQAKAIINSAGPWVDHILRHILKAPASPDADDAGLRLVKGSHIVTRSLFEGEHAYIFQNDDNRIIFAIPYEHDYTLIGTTDVPYNHSDGPVVISEDEITYLCDAASEYFAVNISPKDVQWTYSGVRPLYDDKSTNASAVTRDYVLDIEEFVSGAPFMSIYGGKITTSRKLAEHAMKELSSFLPVQGRAWTGQACLPGGDIKNADFDDFFEATCLKYPWLKAGTIHRLARTYGTRIAKIIGQAKSEADLGLYFGSGLYEKEVLYLMKEEWALTADDILWRRTKLGIHMSKAEQKALKNWFEKRAIPETQTSV